MTEEQNQGPAVQPEMSAQFQVQRLYVNDVTYEVPNAPKIFKHIVKADIKKNLAKRVDKHDDDNHEVVLTETETSTMSEKTA